MPGNLEKAAEIQQCYEFSGPDFNSPGFRRAKYRAYLPTIILTGEHGGKEAAIEVPSKLEVLTRDGKWEDYPVVLIDNPIFSRLSFMVIFLTDGHCKLMLSSNKYDLNILDSLYRDAEKKVLTGSIIKVAQKHPTCTN